MLLFYNEYSTQIIPSKNKTKISLFISFYVKLPSQTILMNTQIIHLDPNNIVILLEHLTTATCRHDPLNT